VKHMVTTRARDGRRVINGTHDRSDIRDRRTAGTPQKPLQPSKFIRADRKFKNIVDRQR
jgi:hypothetical protein